jgi:hypothetical protein
MKVMGTFDNLITDISRKSYEFRCALLKEALIACESNDEQLAVKLCNDYINGVNDDTNR